MLKEWWARMVRVDSASHRGQVLFMAMMLGVATLFALVESLIMLNYAPLLAALFGWAVVGLYALLGGSVFSKGTDVVATMTGATGSSTPSVAQHSNIEAMEMQGRYAEAARAYQDVIISSPDDVVAPEKLAQLALRQLKDYPLAINAYREAEKRHPEPKRRLGYAMLIAGIYRDNLKEYGKAMVELRRIVSTYPEAPNRSRLSAEIDELKAVHFEAK